jgi:ATP-dependent RNA helicase RhlE
MSFDDFGLSEPILRAVAEEGYTHPTPIQRQAIPHVIAGRDLLGCAQTGTGKTAAFALPVLHRLTAEGSPPRGRGRRIRVLVLSPTRELASQISESFRVYGANTPLRQAVIYGGVSQRPQETALRHGVDILVATPGRLLDLMQQRLVDLRDVEIFILDEADRMFDMGFLPDLRRIIAAIPTQRQTLFFSATMPAPIEQLANAVLSDPVQIRVAPVRQTTELIDQAVYHVAAKEKPAVLVDLLLHESVSRSIVFTRTKHGADRVVRQLGQAGIAAEAIHGNKSQNARQRALANFKANRTNVLVATDLAARGIDVDGVSHVFNYELPHEPETYVHRIGRTGRAGATGIAVSLCDDSERKLLKAIERLTRRPIPVKRGFAGESTSRGTNGVNGAASGKRVEAGHGAPRMLDGARRDRVSPAGVATAHKPGKKRRSFARSGR